MKNHVIFIIRMMSELNTGSKHENPSSDSTQAFILKRVSCKAVAIDNMAQGLTGVIYQTTDCQVTFNADRKYYTPSFIDRKDIAAQQQQNQEYKDAFAIKTQEECLHSSIIYKPKPSSNFCFVCKEFFVDYQKHINHPVHKKILASSACEEFIQDLVQSEQKKRKTPACGFLPPQETSRKIRKLDTTGTASALALQYFKESSTCVSIFQSQKIKNFK